MGTDGVQLVETGVAGRAQGRCAALHYTAVRLAAFGWLRGEQTTPGLCLPCQVSSVQMASSVSHCSCAGWSQGRP